MDLSNFVAQVLSLLYISAGIAALRGVLSFNKMIADFEKSSALTFTVGIFTMILGMLIVRYHNHWVKDWTVIITLFGWIGILKGVMLMAFPESVKPFKGMFKKTKPWGIAMILLGLIFGYFGFFV